MKLFQTDFVKVAALTAALVSPSFASAFRADGYEWEQIDIMSGEHHVRLDGFEWQKPQVVAHIPQTVKNFAGVEFTCTYIYSLKASVLEEIYIPATVTEFGSGAFSRNQALRKVVFPSVIKTEYSDYLSDEMFVNCVSLESLVLASNETVIDGETVHLMRQIPGGLCQGCTSLKKVVIPCPVLSIQAYAFGGCDSLEDFYIYSEVPPTLSEYAFTQIDYSKAPAKAPARRNMTLHVPAGSIAAYKASDWSKYFTEVVEAPADPAEAAVDEIGAEMPDAAKAEYFTLDGVKVSNPEPGGVYIMTDGRVSRKVVL